MVQQLGHDERASETEKTDLEPPRACDQRAGGVRRQANNVQVGDVEFAAGKLFYHSHILGRAPDGVNWDSETFGAGNKLGEFGQETGRCVWGLGLEELTNVRVFLGWEGCGVKFGGKEC